MVKTWTSITILGSAGGVAKSFLSILNNTMQEKKDPLHSLITGSTIHLIDCKQKEKAYYTNLFPNISDKLVLHDMNLKDTTAFRIHLQKTHTTMVIDLSWADTIEILDCCNKLGVFYVNSALENTMVDLKRGSVSKFSVNGTHHAIQR